MNALDDLPVVVIGAGPVGLAAAAHLHERGLPFLVLEAGDGPAAAVAQWGHVRLFSPWRYNIDAAARRLLDDAGWVAPRPGGAAHRRASSSPTTCSPWRDLPAAQAARPLRRTRRGGHPRSASTGSAPPAATTAPFLLRLADGDELLARAVIDASGTWSTPNVLGASGIPAHGEADAAAYIEHALPDVLGADRDRFAGRRTLVVGAGHSAANTLLALAELAEQAPGTSVTWAIRAASPARTYGGGDADALPARGALGTRLREHVEAGTHRPAHRLLRADASPPTAGRRVERVRRQRRSGHRRPDRRRRPGSAPTTASPPSCAWTWTRSWAPPGPSPR